MPKYYKIRWQKEDIEEVNRVVRNFNAKINRLIEANPDIKNILPEKVKAKELRALINTRKDLQRELNSLKRFSKRGAEQVVVLEDTEMNVKTTKWQIKEMNRRLYFINRRRKERLEKLSSYEATRSGQKLGYKKIDIGMGTIMENDLRPMKSYTPSINQRDLKKKWYSILSESQSDFYTKRDMKFRENYINTLLQNFKESDISDVVETIKNMNIDEFIERFEDFELAYPPNKEQYEAYLSEIKATWLPNKQYT